VDAGRGRELVNDVTYAFAGAGRVGRNSGQLAGGIGGVAGRRARGHRRSPPLANRHASVDGDRGDCDGVMALTGHMTTGRLLSLTFLLGIGSAVSNPVWQAITPELVPSEDLAAALSLGGVAVNIARAIGPAIGGFIIAASGPWAVFFCYLPDA
jgi:MFS family permease